MNKIKFAKFISMIFDPAFLALLILTVAVIKSPMTNTEMFAWILGMGVLNGLIPLLFLIYFTKKGLIFDDEIKNEKVHKQRISIFVVFLFVVAFEFIFLICTKQYQPLLAVFTGGLITISLALIITYWWKISLHSIMITFFVTMILFLYGIKYWPVILTIPFVFWSRIVLKRHTLLQLIAGMFLAILTVTGTMLLYKYI